MRKLLVAAGLVMAALSASAEMYRVTVTRVGKDIYRDEDSGTVIETRYCYEYVTRDRAVLKWEGRYGTNLLIFSRGQSCDVKSVR